MKDSEKQMHENIRKLFENDLKLIKKEIPTNGIWSVCSLVDTDYHGAVRIIPNDAGEYTLWVDVFETIYDPIYSNALVKGNLKTIADWIEEKSHIYDVYACMEHLLLIAEDD